MNKIFIILLILFNSVNVFASWNISTVDNNVNAGSSTFGMAVDNNGNAHIAYIIGSEPIVYATNSSGAWVKTALTPWTDGTWGYLSIATDSNNKAYICYYNYGQGAINHNVQYVTNASGTWQDIDVGEEWIAGYIGTSIAIDKNNKVHISYLKDLFHDQNPTPRGDLRYISNKTGSFVIETVDNVGRVGEYSSIALDSNDKVHISYYDNTNQDLKYATNASGSWVTMTIDATGMVGYKSSIKIDGNNKVHIAYFSYEYGVKYATNASGSWECKVIDKKGSSPSIALDSENKAFIAYYYTTNKDLKYATNASGNWTYHTVDSDGTVGLYPSIAIDSTNKIHIAYNDSVNKIVKYAENTASVLSWVDDPIYGTDGLDVDTGYESSVFTFKIKYSHPDNEPPVSGYPKLHIKKDGVEIDGSPFTMDYMSGAYNTGATYTYRYTKSLEPGTNYTHYFEARDSSYTAARGTPTSSMNGPNVLATKLTLLNNVFNPATGGKLSIRYDLTKDSDVRISVYDILGEKIIDLINERKTAGTYTDLVWDGKNSNGEFVASGMYIVWVLTDNYQEKKKVVIVK